MQHLAIPDSELYSILYALRCGESNLQELIDAFAEKSTPRALDIMRECHKMKMTLIRIENQLDPK